MKINLEIEYNDFAKLLSLCQAHGFELGDAINDAITLYAFISNNKGRKIEIDENGLISMLVPSCINQDK